MKSNFPTPSDGVLLNAMMSVEYTRDAIARIRTGAERAGRTLADLEFPQLITTAMDDDGDRARDIGRRLVTMYLGQQPHIAKASGMPEEFLRRVHDVMGGWPPNLAGQRIAVTETVAFTELPVFGRTQSKPFATSRSVSFNSITYRLSVVFAVTSTV